MPRLRPGSPLWYETSPAGVVARADFGWAPDLTHPTIKKVGESTFTVGIGTGSEVKTLPSGLQRNDIVLVVLVGDEVIATTDIATVGYASLISSGSSVPGNCIRWKRMGTVPDSGVLINQDPVCMRAGIIRVYRGVDITQAIDQSSNQGAGTTGDPDAPNHTTISANTLVVAVGFWDDDDAADGITAPSSFSDLISVDTGQGSTTVGATAALATWTFPQAGIVDPGAFTGPADDNWRSVTFAFRPAVVSTPAELTLTDTEDDDTLASVISVASSAIAGVLAVTEASETVATAARLAIAASLAASEASDSGSAAVLIALKGSVNGTDASDTLTAAAQTQIAGALATTEGDETVATVGRLAIAGALAATEAPDSGSAAALIALTGSVNGADASDVLSATIAVGAVPISVALAATESSDTLSAAAVVAVKGASAGTEDGDVVSSAMQVALKAAAVLTETGDAVSAATSVRIAAALAATEASDSGSGAATIALAGSLNGTDASDSLTATATISIKAAAAIIEASDTLAASSSPGTFAVLNVTEAADALSAAAQTTLSTVGTLVEASDVLSAAVVTRISASGALIEESDTTASAAAVSIVGSVFAGDFDVLTATVATRITAAAAITEADDTLVAVSLPGILATLAVIEESDTLFAEAGEDVPVVVPPRRVSLGRGASYTPVFEEAPLLALLAEVAGIEDDDLVSSSAVVSTAPVAETPIVLLTEPVALPDAPKEVVVTVDKPTTLPPLPVSIMRALRTDDDDLMELMELLEW